MDLPTRTQQCGETTAPCPEVPEFRRLRYLYGQLLGASDFQTEQAYHREKLRLHNRCLHGSGVICGLLVKPEPLPDPCEPEGLEEARQVRAQIAALQDSPGHDAELEQLRRRAKDLPDPDCWKPPPTRVAIECGVALDCHGNELVVRRPIMVPLWETLPPDERSRCGDEPVTLYLSVCFCEQGVDPIRPVLNDPCGAIAGCEFGRIRESVRVVVSLKPPANHYQCDTCCTKCEDCCLPLARIDCFRPGYPLEHHAIHNEIRHRIVARPAQTTVITGINWVHGATYTKAQGESITGTFDETKGIVVSFSRQIHASTLRRGVVELWRLEGGGGRSGYMTEVRGDFEDLPDEGMVSSFRYRQTDEEGLDGGDRILVTIRCAFILDACCQPVDGAHVGGRVPHLPSTVLPDHHHPPKDCLVPPWGYPPWTSGNGSPGSTFESWFTIAPHERRAPGANRPRSGDAS